MVADGPQTTSSLNGSMGNHLRMRSNFIHPPIPLHIWLLRIFSLFAVDFVAGVQDYLRTNVQRKHVTTSKWKRAMTTVQMSDAHQALLKELESEGFRCGMNQFQFVLHSLYARLLRYLNVRSGRT